MEEILWIWNGPKGTTDWIQRMRVKKSKVT